MTTVATATGTKTNEPELAPGFKMTELGPLPEEWEVDTLGDVAPMSRKPKHLASTMPKQVPFVPMALVPSGSLYATQFELRPPARAKSGVYFKTGDILVARITPCLENGRIAIARGIPNCWGIATTEVYALKPQRVDGIYLLLLLRASSTRDYLASKLEGATGRQRLPKAVLRSLRLPLPALHEQQKIATVLNRVRQAVEATERIITALRQLKKSLMRHLFTYGAVPVEEAENVELKETQVGEIPKAWRVVMLGECCERPRYGLTATATEKQVGPRFLRITDIQDGSVNWATVPYCRSPDAETTARYILNRGDLVIARIGATTGKAFLIGDCPEAVFASYLIRVRTRDGVLPAYLGYFSQTDEYWTQINAAKGGRLKQGVNIPVLTNLVVPLPPEAEQQRIADALGALDTAIAQEQTRRGAIESLFNTLLHLLMTGQVRVKDWELEEVE